LGLTAGALILGALSVAGFSFFACAPRTADDITSAAARIREKFFNRMGWLLSRRLESK
jgi:hypothetical protein